MRKITFDLKATDLLWLKKSAYKYTNVCSFDFKVKDQVIDCEINFKDDISDADFIDFTTEFRNDVLDESLREQIAEKTAPVRNLILAYAFSKADLD